MTFNIFAIMNEILQNTKNFDIFVITKIKWCDFIDQHFFYVTDSFLTWTKMLEFYYEHFFELLILSRAQYK
jgi:hypothetical protein